MAPRGNLTSGYTRSRKKTINLRNHNGKIGASSMRIRSLKRPNDHLLLASMKKIQIKVQQIVVEQTMRMRDNKSESAWKPRFVASMMTSEEKEM